jgi:hypothetical protein
MACTEERNKFDELTKMMASGVTRRDTLKWVGATALGAMLSVVGIRQAEALAGGCQNKGVCGTYTPCDGAPDISTCACGTRAKGVKGWCFQNTSCSGLIPCTKNSDCRPGGKAVKCVVNSCCGSGGVCLAKCSAPLNGVTRGGGRTATG